MLLKILDSHNNIRTKIKKQSQPWKIYVEIRLSIFLRPLENISIDSFTEPFACMSIISCAYPLYFC